jgi:Raf kinase inhibitor-like YbhB/YbcL family protein
MVLTLSSPAFKSGAEIPHTHAAEDKNLPPLLDFRGVPPGTRSMVLTLTDLTPEKGGPVSHWIVHDIPADSRGIGPSGLPPPGSSEGLNDFDHACYSGPNPPKGSHKYEFRLYALDIALAGLRRPPLAQVEAAMKGHILAHASLVGT